MSTQQDIYAAGSESRPPMLNKENYVPWSSRLLRYAKSRPNEKLIHNSILNGPYVRRMIPEPGDANREVTVTETFHLQTNDELSDKEFKEIEDDNQAIQTILLGLPEDIYAAVDKKIASNLKFLNNLQPEWSRHVTIVHQTKDLYTADYTQLYNFLKYNQKEVDELKVERLAKTQDPLALMGNSNNPYAFAAPHQDQSSFNQNYLQQPMPNPEDIIDPTTAMNMALALVAKAFKLNNSTPTNNNQRISSNPRNRQIAQPGIGQDRQMQMVGGNGRNQFRQYVGQNAGNLAGYNDNGLIGVQWNGNQNQIENGNPVVARAKGNAAGQNENQIRCYNYKGKEKAGIQLQAEEYDLMAAAADLDEIEEVNGNCILMANLQQASILEEQYTELLEPIPESHQVPQNDNDVISEDTSVEQGGETVEQHPTNFKETRALYESLYQNLAIEVKKVNSVNRKLKETNANLTTELARFKNQTRCFEISQEKYDKLERCYQQSVYQEQCLSKKINALHLSIDKQIMTLSEQIFELNKQFSKEKSIVSFLLEEKKKLKSDFKTHEDELLDKQIQLEKKIKELNNILLKTSQLIQTIHMLSPKPDSFYHTEQKMALGYQNPFYLKQAQKKQQSLYDGKVLLEKHDPPVVHDSEETLQLAQESRKKIKQLNKEIKLANYTKINHLSGVFVSQTAKSREELYFSNASKTANVSKSISIPNADFSDDTTPSVAHNWSSSAHQELHKIVREENFPIVNQVDARVQNFEIHFLKESAKFVGDFKSLENEADASLTKYKALELEIERLLKAVYKKCDECKYDKILYDKAYKDMQQKIKRLQAQLGDLKGKSIDISCVSDTRNPLSQKLENANVELEFQVLNYPRENAHLKTTYKNLFDSIFVSRTQTKSIIASLQNELQSTIYKNAKLRTQLFKKVFDQKDNTQDTSKNTKFSKKPIVENLPKVGETNALSNPVTSNSVSTPQESKGVNNDKVLAPGMFRINPFKTSREEKHVLNTVSARNRTKPITVSQPPVITKKDVNSDLNGLSSIGDVISKVVCAMCKKCLISVNHNECLHNYVNGKNSHGKKQKAKVSFKENQMKYQPKVTKPKKVGTRESLATPKPKKSRLLLRWLPTGRLLDQEGKIVDSSESDSQSDCVNGDNACTSNSLEPKIKRFPNSTSLLDRVYFVEGLGHNLFSAGQFCDSDLEVAFRRNAGFVRNLEGVDLLKRDRSTNLYTINLHEMASASLICLMARASSTKSWLWHQRLSHLNFDTINDLARNDLVAGLLKFKYHKEYLCPSCEQGKSKIASHPPKPVPNSRQRLHLLHMDLCGPMRISSINGKRYVLVIVDDYSRYTWVHFLISKDEAPEVIITFLKRITILLQSPVIIIRTDNDTEFKNHVLKEYFDVVGISYQMPSAIATACFTQNRSIIHRHFNKTPYELINGRKLDISFLHVFGALCYPKNDREDIGKLGAKGDIGFFIGYSADSCAYKIYNQRTKKIIETMNVSFDELSVIAFEQRSSKPRLHSMTSGQISSGLDLTYAPSTITMQQPSKGELDLLFEAVYDDYIGGQPSATERTVLPAQEPQVRQLSTASTTIADTAPTPTNSYSLATNIPITLHDVEELNSNAMVDGNTFVNLFANSSISTAASSSSQNVNPSNMHTNQLRSDGDMCMYALSVSTMEPKNVKEAMTDPAWIHSMQEELFQFKRLDALLREELYFSNNSKTANVSKSFLIPNEDLSDDTTPSVACKFLNEVKSTIVTLQRVVKQRMTIETHNWASSAHQEVHKIVREEIFPIVNQVDARLQIFKIQFLKEAAKFVGDFKSLANKADASLAKHKALELEIERLLKAVVS
nr:retrovirus-related Pol polyprotein from transposon TNT 1-94 [Tanacetum cinerariifolium]